MTARKPPRKKSAKATRQKPARKKPTRTKARPAGSREDPGVVSAQVVFKLAGHDAQAPVTSETISSLAPPARDMAAVADYFRGLGFETGPIVGTSFSISGPPAAFDKAFRRPLPRKAGQLSLGGHEIPLAALPANVRGLLQAVVFTPPPDFGPGGGF